MGTVTIVCDRSEEMGCFVSQHLNAGDGEDQHLAARCTRLGAWSRSPRPRPSSPGNPHRLGHYPQECPGKTGKNLGNVKFSGPNREVQELLPLGLESMV